MKRMVRVFFSSNALLALSVTFFISALPAVVALIDWKMQLVISAMTLAIVVFPVPGGPYRMIEERVSASIIRRSETDS